MSGLSEQVMAVLDEHRWKSMGVSSVDCECGAILYGPGLTQFPADEAFRRHIAAHIIALLRAGEQARVDAAKADGWHEALRWIRHYAETTSPDHAIEHIDRAEPFNPYRAALRDATHTDAPEATAEDAEDEEGGCDCTELCSMGPTCPGGMLARLPGSGCWRTQDGTP